MARPQQINAKTVAKANWFTGHGTTNRGAIEANADKNNGVPNGVYPNTVYSDDDNKLPALAVKVTMARGRKVEKNTLSSMGTGIKTTSVTEYVTPLTITKPTYTG